MPFDIDNFKYDSGNLALPKSMANKSTRGRIKGLFLKGPIPWDWLVKAMRLSGKALHVALILWQEAGFHRVKTVKLRTSVVDKVGFSRRSARRALKQLESAGLIETERKPGQLTTVRIMDVKVEN